MRRKRWKNYTYDSIIKLLKGEKILILNYCKGNRDEVYGL